MTELNVIIPGGESIPGLSAAIVAWLGVPARWWIEPTTLFQQSQVKVWGQGELPEAVRIDEFWAWGSQTGQPRAMHGVRRGDSWRVQKYEGGSFAPAAGVARPFSLETDDKRYQAAKCDEGEIQFRIDAESGSVLLNHRGSPS